MTYVSASMRRAVIARAGDCCEYCRLSQADNPFSFHIEHIISSKHGGETTVDNLALSCPDCNVFKGSDIGSIDPETGLLTPLFNPRHQSWNAHFHLNHPNAQIEPLTPEGRVTVSLLRLNSAEQIDSRSGLIRLGRYPC